MTPISDLTDDEVSRWIAEKLEPGMNKRHPPFLHISPLQCWQGDVNHIFQPRDMIHDASMTVMLLEKLAEYGLRFDSETSLSFHPELKTWCASICGITGVGRKHLGRAVAEAFMLANGYGKEKP